MRWGLAEIAATGNLMDAARRARKGKSRRPDVEEWWQRRESHVLRLHEELRSGKWKPGGYRLFEIREPKRRVIAAAPFGDRVVHHALCVHLQPELERRFVARSFSCQIGKGTTAARECVRKLVNRHSLVLKCDVRKFFDSIDHDVLAARLHDAVSCEGVRWLMDEILGSYRKGDGRACGLPIGNLTSQLWGNFLLDGLDHWVTEECGFGGYARYTDDFLIFGDNKDALWMMREGVVDRLAELRLKLAEPKSRMLACREGVPFCGWRFFPGKRPRVLGETKRRFQRRKRSLRKAGNIQQLSEATFAWYQYSREGNCEGLRRAWATKIYG